MYEKSFFVKTMSILSVLGILFSGYLTYYTYSTGASACELFFFGLPSCFYGLIVYSLIFIFSLLLIKSGVKNKKIYFLAFLALFGIIFSASLTTYVLLKGASCGPLYIFGIPPCMIGLMMFTVLLVLTFLLL